MPQYIIFRLKRERAEELVRSYHFYDSILKEHYPLRTGAMSGTHYPKLFGTLPRFFEELDDLLHNPESRHRKNTTKK